MKKLILFILIVCSTAISYGQTITLQESSNSGYFELNNIEYPKAHFGIKYDGNISVEAERNFTVYNVFTNDNLITSRHYSEVVGVTSWDGLIKLLSNLEVIEASVDVNIQDQHSEVIDLYVSQLIQTVVLTTNTAINDKVITITSGVQPINGNIICLKEASAFYQGVILSSVVNGTDWDVTLDTPLDFAYTTLGGCSERNINLAVDGSVTAVEFVVSPVNLTAGTEWDVTRLLGSMLDSSSMDDGLFGALPALTNGMYFRIENGVFKNLLNIKTNGDWRIRMFDVDYSAKAPAGQYGLSFRKTYAGQSKSGVTLRIKDDDRIVVVVQDNLTGLDSFRIVVQGHVVEN